MNVIPQPLGPKQEQWLAAMTSGKYKQGKHYLKNGDEYCCLGVLCEAVLNFPSKLSVNPQTDIVSHEIYDFFAGKESEYAVLPVNQYLELGLRSDTGYIDDSYLVMFHESLIRHEFTGGRCINLVGYNDNGATFQQLASAMRELPQAVFTQPK